MLSEASRNGYNWICATMLEEFDIPSDVLPSYHILTKNRPEIEPLLLEKQENLYNNGASSGNYDVNNVADVALRNQEEVERSVVAPGPQTKEEAAILEVRRDNEKIEGSRNKGGYEKVVKLMTNKSQRNTRQLTPEEKFLFLEDLTAPSTRRQKKRK